MRTRRALIPLTLLVAGALAGCDGPFRDRVAATVNGREITTAEVEAVAGDAEALQLCNGSPRQEQCSYAGTDPGRASAEVRRAALTILIQDRVVASELDRLGEQPSADDRTQADQQLAQLPAGLDSAVEEVVRRLVLNDIAVARITAVDAAAVDDAAVADYFASHAADFGDLSCIEGLIGYPDGVEAARAAIEGGSTFDAEVAANPEAVQALDGTSTTACVARGMVNDPGLAELIETGGVGVVQQYDTSNQGTPVSLLIRVTSRRPAAATDDVIAQQIRQLLEQQASQEAQAQQQKVIEAILKRADVHVDPRYGRLDLSAGAQSLLVPPPTPIVPRASSTSTGS